MKSTLNKKPLTKFEYKAKRFGERYVANNFNGTKTALELYDTKNPDVGATIASENLRKPQIREAIIDALNDIGVDNDLISKIHKRNLTQEAHLPSSNQALDMYYKIGGTYAPEKKLTGSFTIPNNTKELEAKIAELINELNSIKES